MTFEDLTTLTPGEDDIDRQLKELSSSSEVDDELARMKAELGSGNASAGELGAGEAPGQAASTGGDPAQTTSNPSQEQAG